MPKLSPKLKIQLPDFKTLDKLLFIQQIYKSVIKGNRNISSVMNIMNYHKEIYQENKISCKAK